MRQSTVSNIGDEKGHDTARSTLIQKLCSGAEAGGAARRRELRRRLHNFCPAGLTLAGRAVHQETKPGKGNRVGRGEEPDERGHREDVDEDDEALHDPPAEPPVPAEVDEAVYLAPERPDHPSHCAHGWEKT
ncbi:hypothetical protein THAOC_25585, partial [Thalassiosira oceanica]